MQNESVVSINPYEDVSPAQCLFLTMNKNAEVRAYYREVEAVLELVRTWDHSDRPITGLLDAAEKMTTAFMRCPEETVADFGAVQFHLAMTAMVLALTRGWGTITTSQTRLF